MSEGEGDTGRESKGMNDKCSSSGKPESPTTGEGGCGKPGRVVEMPPLRNEYLIATNPAYAVISFPASRQFGSANLPSTTTRITNLAHIKPLPHFPRNPMNVVSSVCQRLP